MQYTVAHIRYAGEAWERDVVEQALCDIGFETFDGDDAYIQTALLDEAALRATLDNFEHVTLTGVEDCPDENWNATWEAEHPVEELPMGVRIIPHCAFGAGHHETTGMMIEALGASLKVSPSETGVPNALGLAPCSSTVSTGDLSTTPPLVLDMGCGTGVLGIMALRCGAGHVTFVDIDDKSVENTRENLLLNGYPINAEGNKREAPNAEGNKREASNNEVLNSSTVPEGRYDLIMANIHRNILLAQMADYARCLNAGGQLWISGFYENDIAPLREEAERHGLHYMTTHARGEWRMCQFGKQE